MKKILALFSVGLLRKTAIRYRLITSLILLSLLPLLISGTISYGESSRAIQKNTRLLSTEVVKQVARNVQLQMAQIERSSETLVLSQRVQTALARYDRPEVAEKSPARAELTRILLETYGSFDYFNQKYFLGTDGRITDSQVFPQLGESAEHLISLASPQFKGRPYWATLVRPGGQRSLVMLREIFFKSNGRPAGSLFLGLRAAHFSGIFDNVDLGANSTLFIVDADSGAILVKSSDQFSFSTQPSAAPALLADIKGARRQNASSGFVTYENPLPTPGRDDDSDKVVAAYSPIPNTSWYVVGTIPYTNLVVEAQSVRNKIILIGWICFVCSIGLAFLISQSISIPLEKLIGIMKQAQGGNYAIRMTHEGNDELTVLSRQFNEMTRRIDQEHEQLEVRVSERTHALEQANRQLAALSLTDSLTGISNRRRFDEVLSTELLRAARGKQALALMMIDVDFFKSYNDHYGHHEGDVCLRRVADVLQTHACRAGELVARYGGEEFVLLMADTDLAGATALAENIRRSIEALRLPHAQSPLAAGCVTISVGVVVLIPDDKQSPASFIRIADQSMYQAKKSGRNQVAVHGSAHAGEHTRRDSDAVLAQRML